jgi:hypothetical protein
MALDRRFPQRHAADRFGAAAVFMTEQAARGDR